MLKNNGSTLLLLGIILALSIPLQSQTLRDAARLDAEGKCDEAEQYYRAALAKSAPSQALLNNAGNHYLVCGQAEKAKAYFEKLLRINPLHTNANLQLARIVTEQKQGKKALEYLSRIKESDPEVLLLRAEALHWSGKSAAALAILDDLQKRAQTDPRLLFLLGLTCARLSLYDRAEHTFNSALALRPGDFEILFNLGRAAARARHYERAQRVLEAALKIHPENVDLLLELGRVCAARQDYRRAFFLLAQARQKAPGRVDVLMMLARTADDAGYYEDSASAYDEYLRLRPDDDAARRDRAKACGYTESRRDEAGRDLDWYLGKHPNDPLGHFVYAQVFWWPEPQKSLAHLTEAVRLDPDSVSIRFSRAWMLQRQGQMAESLPDLQAALRLEPNNFRILDLIGLAHLALEQPAEAERVMRQAFAIAPENPEVVLHSGRALMALGREEEAQSFMEKYQKIRPQGVAGVRKQVKMMELATLAAPEQREREIERFRRDAREHPERPDYQLHLACLLWADQRKEEALREFQVLKGLNANSQVWEDAGTFLLGSKEYGLAREFLERAAEDRPSARLNIVIALSNSEGAGHALQYMEKNPEAQMIGDWFLLKANLLDAAGRKTEVEKTLNLGLERVSTNPLVVPQAVFLLLRLNRQAEALDLLERAVRVNPQDSDLPLAKAILLGLMNRYSDAEKSLKELESRWPEWDRAYLAHGLLLEQMNRPGDARQKLQTATALGSQDPSLNCALARLAGAASPEPRCNCLKGLGQLLFSDCLQQP
jgi:tetratricopeptide (TPR) repeat protein